MSPRLHQLLLTSLLVGGSFSALAHAEMTAEEIMHKNYASNKVKDSRSESVFRLVDAKGQERIRNTVGFTRLVEGSTDNMRLVAFTAPADIKGTKTLLIEHAGADDDIWIFLPAMKKVRRLVSNNKKDSFIGTDFSYGDVIGHKVEDWNHTLVKEENVQDKDCFVVESKPKTPEITQNSGYSKRVNWIDKKSYVTLKGQLFDPKGELIKEVSADKVSLVDAKNKKWQAMIIEARNVQTGRKTIIEFKKYKANTGVPKNIFTPGFLEKN
ncbi:MAG: outer membrane lipoprotein-sorting protein [Bdellovibrionales bacterium]